MGIAVLLGWAALACSPCETALAQERPRTIDFDREIAPILARRCLDCHDASSRKGGLNLSGSKDALAGGDSGAVLRPGNVEESLLWQRVRDAEMPPKKPLPPAEKQLLQEWIASGARWGTDPIDPYAITSESRAGYDWWSLKPLRGAAPPVTTNPWVRTPVDEFVLVKLSEAGLKPSADADRRTLIRRLSFDLLGLPPTPDEIAEFLADESPDAYERLVDRYLSSPRYGERWARHWLDIVRFGESQGFERDKLRTNSWRYRDWVVSAWNSDLPYDEFVRRQIAGDVLAPENADAMIATGFLVAGPWDEVGQSQQSAAMKAVVQQDELEDLVSAVGQTFLGLTVNCARCHDHKFDPIRQADYYRLGAALGGVRHGERPVTGAAVQEQSRNWSEGHQARLKDVRAALERLEARAVAAIRATRVNQPAVAPPSPLARWEFNDDLKDSLGTLHGTAHDGARLEGGKLVLDGRGYVSTAPLNADLREKTLESWVQLETLDQQGGGVLSVQSLDGRQFDAIVFGEREARRWMAGSNFFLRSESFSGPEETAAAMRMVHVAIVYHADGRITGYRDGVPYGKPFQSKGIVKFLKDETAILFGLRHRPPGGNRHLRAKLDRAQLYDRALTPEEVAASAGVPNDFVSPEAIQERLTPDERARRDELLFEIAHLERLQSRALGNTVYAVAPIAPPPAFRLNRGNPAEPREPAPPGGLSALRTVANFSLPAEASDAERRKALAAWITHSDQPLFARVLANRLWHYHFGRGIVETCNDFGWNGGRPSHPEMLDWLASELQRHDYRIKPLQRVIVTSAVYRQASIERPEAVAVDADNRRLWRRTPQRLEAEAIRDAMLAASGRLTSEIGGPGFEDFSTFVQNSQFYVMRDAEGNSFSRRSVYRTWVRSGRSPFLDVFDCPDPSTFTPQRAVTTTPLQAMSLLNNSFTLRMSRTLADRLARDAGPELEQQIRLGNLICFGRQPDEHETTLLKEFAKQHGVAALCRVWFNSNEFLYID